METQSPPIAFILIQVGNYLITLLCLWHLWRKERALAFSMAAAILFGYLVEYSQVTQCVAKILFPDQPVVVPYDYPYALVMLPGPVPLGICLSWGLIISAVMQTAAYLLPDSDTQRLGMSRFKLFCLRAFIGGFLAISIDFALDPSLVKMGFWVWHIEPQLWFGIPWSNFIGWFVIVFCFATAQQVGFLWFPPGSKGVSGDFLVAFLAIVPAFVLFVIIMVGWVLLTGINPQKLPETLLVAVFYCFFAVSVIRYLFKYRRDRDFDLFVVLGPFYLYGWSVITLFSTGLYLDYPPLIIIAPVVCGLGVIGFLWPYLDTLKK
ncbi:MAG: carotenoid biosynthesis protein [Deltaproteobacteria bacterium]|nr:carotenoid biosynthesis protein [Deltaproteobacteria bacterium]